jgi:hypothetical protein
VRNHEDRHVDGVEHRSHGGPDGGEAAGCVASRLEDDLVDPLLADEGRDLLGGGCRAAGHAAEVGSADAVATK